MAESTNGTQAGTRKASKHVKQLRVIFDTNALYTGSASDLVRQEVADLMKASVYPDLSVTWYLPDVVRHERQYQMQTEALKLLPAVEKVERLLGHNLNITEAILKERVEKTVSARQEELGLVSLPLDAGLVDWDRLVLNALYRQPPFEAGQKEKGFRDAVLLESFAQLVADSPRTAKTCRVVLVTKDGLLAESVKARLDGNSNVTVLENLEDLKGLINTLVSEVDESFVAVLKPKAKKLFFVPEDDDTLFYTERIQDRIPSEFAAVLSSLPEGAASRSTVSWRIGVPNFVKKLGQTIYWASQIRISAKASKSVSEAPEPATPGTPLADLMKVPHHSTATSTSAESGHGKSLFWHKLSRLMLQDASKTITTHKGVDTFEVIWSTQLTTRHELRKPKVEEIKHIGVRWEPAI